MELKSAAASPHTICTVRLGDRLFALPVSEVREAVREPSTTPVPLTPESITGLVNLRGRVMTAVDLRAALNLPARPTDERAFLLVAESGRTTIALVVDKVQEVLELSEEDYMPAPANLDEALSSVVDGGYRPDKRMVLRIDLARLIDRIRRETGALQRRWESGQYRLPPRPQ